MKLRFKLAILFSVLALIPLILVGNLNYINQRDSLLKQTVEQLISLADVQEKRVNEKLDRYIEQIKLVTSRTQLRLSLDNFIKTGDLSELKRVENIINDAKNSASLINNISILSPEGEVVASTDESRVGNNYKKDFFFQNGLRAHELHDVILNKHNITESLLSGPLILNGETIGVAVVFASAVPLIKITDDYTGLGQTGEVILAKRNRIGDAVFLTPLRFDAGAALQRAVPADDLNVPMTLAIAGTETVLVGEGFIDYRGEQVFAVTRFIDPLGWGLVVKVDRDEALAPIVSLTRSTILITLLSVLVIILMAYLITGAVVRPLRSLTLFAQNLQSGNFSIRTQVIEKDDEVSFLAVTLNNMADKLHGLYKNLEDKVRERTEKLAEAKAKNEAILGNIGDGIVFTDLKKRILMLNRAGEDLIGQKNSEVLGKDWAEVVGVSDISGTPILLKDLPIYQALKSRNNKSISTLPTDNYNYKHKSGKLIPVSITASRVEHEGKPLGIVIVFRDASSERQIDQMKTEFVSIASHQLRTPLTAIKLFVEMLRSGKPGDLTKQQEEYLADVSFSTERMIRLVNDLLNVSRLETGRLKIEPTPTNLVDFVEEIIADAGPLCENKKCQISFKQDGSDFENINIDQALLRQVVHNFVTNAIHYSHDGGEIRVSLKSDEKEYEISVKDEGIGIPDEAKKKIFKKFYRADNAQKTEAVGSGLGMYVAKMITEAYGGRIWFDSVINKGTTFYVTIPKEGMLSKEGQKSIKN